ncbi:MAG: DUF4065 domain-containing protein [Deltaproteobacteria bacterium]|nr:DUF4065 domain-containing protein [Deltaproteobacteria bacterium]
MTEALKRVTIINSAIAVANWFIERNRKESGDLTHLKLQKLLYFAQGWHLAYYDVPLFEDPIEAWKYGPVVRSVYFALSRRGKNEVIKDPIEGNVVKGVDYTTLGTPNMAFPDDGAEIFMRSVWKSYAKKSPWELVSMMRSQKGQSILKG